MRTSSAFMGLLYFIGAVSLIIHRFQMGTTFDKGFWEFVVGWMVSWAAVEFFCMGFTKMKVALQD